MSTTQTSGSLAVIPCLPMLAKDAQGKPPRLPWGSEWVIEKKLDGWRWIVHITADGVRCFSGRNGVQRTTLDLEFELAWLPDDTVLDGELIVDDGKTGMNGSPKVSTALARGDKLTFVVFDCLRVAGTDVTRRPWHERRALLEKIADLGCWPNDHLRLSEVYDADPELHERWLAEGYEGSIAKRRDALYYPGKRSDVFTKVKPQQSDEAVVIGFVAGKGGIVGQVGAFEMRMLCNGVETSVGVPPALRAEVTRHGADWLGKVIEFRHHGLREDSGKPRHPVFVCRRDDRSAVIA